MFDLPNNDLENERILLIPSESAWLGKRPDRATAFNDLWIRAQIVSGTIVPPRGSGPDTMGVWLRLLAWGCFLGLCSLPWLFNLWR